MLDCRQEGIGGIEAQIADHAAAMPVGGQREIFRGVLAEQIQRCDMEAIRHRQRAAAVVGIGGVGQRAVLAEGDVAEADAVAVLPAEDGSAERGGLAEHQGGVRTGERHVVQRAARIDIAEAAVVDRGVAGGAAGTDMLHARQDRGAGRGAPDSRPPSPTVVWSAVP